MAYGVNDIMHFIISFVLFSLQYYYSSVVCSLLTPCGKGLCVDCLMMMHILLPWNHFMRNNLTFFMLLCCDILLRAQVCPGYDSPELVSLPAVGTIYNQSIIYQLSHPVWRGHSCIDCLLSMCILLPRTNTQEINLTLFIIFCRVNLLRAKLWTVIQCPGHDGKLQPHRVNILPYTVWDLACWW